MKDIIVSLEPWIIEDVEREVDNGIVPVKKQFEKLEAEMSELREAVENQNNIFNNKKDKGARM